MWEQITHKTGDTKIKVPLSAGELRTQYKRHYGDKPPTWVAKSASWCMNDPLQNAKFGK